MVKRLTTVARLARIACIVYLNHEWNAAFSRREINNYRLPRRPPQTQVRCHLRAIT